MSPERRMSNLPRCCNVLIDTLLAVVNSSISLLLLYMFAVCIFDADNPYAYYFSMIFSLPVTAYLIAELCVWFQSKRWLRRGLGLMNYFLAGFVLFALVTNIFGAASSDEPFDYAFNFKFAAICIMLITYLGFCGWWRLRRDPTSTGSLGGNQTPDNKGLHAEHSFGRVRSG